MVLKQKVKKAIVPVAGLGTRFLPVTKAIPKEMLPIVDRPSIQWVVDEAFESGIEQVIFVNGHHKKSIEDYFDVNYELNDILTKRGNKEELRLVEEVSNKGVICSIRQRMPLGLGHAVLCARPLLGNEPFAVMLGDDVIFKNKNQKPAIGQLIEAFSETGLSQVALMKVPKEEIHKYGAAEGKVDKKNKARFLISNLVEKPKKGTEKTDQAIVGRYVLTPAIWDLLEQVNAKARGEVQLTDALKMLLTTAGLMGCNFSGQRIDTGDRIGYLRANLLYALSREDMRAEVRRLLEELM